MTHRSTLGFPPPQIPIAAAAFLALQQQRAIAQAAAEQAARSKKLAKREARAGWVAGWPVARVALTLGVSKRKAIKVARESKWPLRYGADAVAAARAGWDAGWDMARVGRELGMSERSALRLARTMGWPSRHPIDQLPPALRPEYRYLRRIKGLPAVEALAVVKRGMRANRHAAENGA